MKVYQRQFVELAISHGALRFGEFHLKSGRVSPYFFNAGEFCSGAALAQLGRCYAAAIDQSAIEFDMLFGPAYKGIPLVAATAIALANDYGKDLPYCFNRKEAKAHGEGGTLVGASLAGRVLIIDDVITAGTAIGDVMAILYQQVGKAAGVAIGLDRMERGRGVQSAIAEVESRYGIPVTSIIDLDQIVGYLQQRPDSAATLSAITEYRKAYGV